MLKVGDKFRIKFHENVRSLPNQCSTWNADFIASVYLNNPIFTVTEINGYYIVSCDKELYTWGNKNIHLLKKLVDEKIGFELINAAEPRKIKISELV